MPSAYIVADSAKLQVHNLPHEEKRALRALFDGRKALDESRSLEGGD